MFSFIKNTDLIEQASQQFIDPHPCFYSFPKEILPLTNRHPHLRLDEQEVITRLQVAGKEVENRVRLHVIANTKNEENCILYLHGLSSYCLEGKFLIPFLSNSFSLCLFDSRSHGKNTAPYVTYGLLESQELVEILKALVKRGFRNVVLWGRSMGAVACLRAIQEYADDLIMQHVRYVVADSPFSSFKMIATEQISKIVSLPDFLSGVLANAFTSKIEQKYGINLNEISLEHFNSKIPITFFYSSKDQMMGVQHIQTITQNYTGSKDICDIKMLHNDQRPAWVILRAMGKIYAALKSKKQVKKEDSKKRGLSIAKFNSQKFLTVVTPSNLDANMRKSMRIVPFFKFEKPHRTSEYHQHTKENSALIQRPARSTMDPHLKRSCILGEVYSSSSIIKLGTPTIKGRKNISQAYF